MLNDVKWCSTYLNVTFGCLSLNTTFWCDHQPLLSLSAPPRLSSRSDIARALPLCWSQDWQLAKPQPLQLKYPLVIKHGLEHPPEKRGFIDGEINDKQWMFPLPPRLDYRRVARKRDGWEVRMTETHLESVFQSDLAVGKAAGFAPPRIVSNSSSAMDVCGECWCKQLEAPKWLAPPTICVQQHVPNKRFGHRIKSWNWWDTGLYGSWMKL